MSDYYTQDFSDLRLPGENPRGEVDKCIPRFFLAERLRGDKIDYMEMVEIITPGDRLCRPIQRVSDEHRARWSRQYTAFKSGAEPTVAGTPFVKWTNLDWSTQDQFRAAGFQTIEQLAEAADGQLSGITNGMLWRRKAQIFLESNKSTSAKDSEIEALKARLAALEGAHNVSTQSGPGDVRPKNRGGRPRKTRPESGQVGQPA